MLQAHLTDGALAAAKAWSHESADLRHVRYAIVQHFRDQPEVAELLARAKAALGPHGDAHEVPTLTGDAVALVESIHSAEDALASLKSLTEDSPRKPAEDADPELASEAAVASSISETADRQQAPETVAEVLAELDALVGLATVKVQVRRVIAVVQANRERAKAGFETINPGLHLVFTGAPGTGKTTVARLIARLYAASGALPGSNFTEVGRSDLVAGYVGQTAMKTSAVIEKTRPGVLFIDEAYALTPSHASDFGAEAIATLVKAMEDQRDELAVVVAGYRDEMADFVESNPGLRSRLRTFIDFPDYAPGELVEIFAGFVNSTGLRMSGNVLEKAGVLFSKVVDQKNFGNARYARSLFESAYARMAIRAAEDGEVKVSELTELVLGDLAGSEAGPDPRSRRIGFGKPEGTGGAATSEATAGDATAGDATAGDATAGDATAGEATAGEATAGEATAGEATAGEATESS